jgi:hypothetical protein
VDNCRKKISILIPDGESYIHLGVLRSLSGVKQNIRLYVMSEARNMGIRYSKVVTGFIYHPYIPDAQEWTNHINSLVKKFEIDVIMPMFETTGRRLIENRDLLIGPEKLLLPNSLEEFDRAWDKSLLSKHLYLHQLPGPRSCSVEEYMSQKDSSLEMNFPLLIKPTRDSGGGKGIKKFQTDSELRSYLETNDVVSDCQVQEFIYGHDLGCNVLCKNGKILAYTIQKGTVFKEKDYTPQVGLKMIHDKTVLQLAADLMESLNWNGVANIDIRFDSQSQKSMVLEINPRFWYSVLASTAAGVNFPWLYCLSTMGQYFKPPSYKDIEHLEYYGIIRKFKRNPLFVLNMIKIWRHTPVRYQVLDPLMTGYHLLWSLKNRLFKVLTRLSKRFSESYISWCPK